MKKNILLIAILFIIAIPVVGNKVNEIETNIINYKESASTLAQLSGTYTSTDNKKIIVNDDGTVLYEGTYSLTVTEASTGNTISGKIGTNNKSITLYQLNDTTLVSSATMTYTHNSASTYLYDYTVFKTNKTVTPDSNGTFELWRNNSKVNSYNTLQDAINVASINDTIKITKDLTITEGAYIDKNITIDGNGHILDKSKWANPLFVIEENINANISNLTVDGGDNTFEIDYSTETPSIKENTLNNTVKSKTPLLISRGNLTTNKFNVQNYNTVQKGTAMRILRGKAQIKNGKFNHNYGYEEAVVINTGSNLRTGETNFPVEELSIENCEFKNNYVPGGSGGAVLITYTKTIRINNSKFFNNIVTTSSSGGGAIYYDTSGQRIADSLNIDYPNFYIDNSYFEGNYSGNDGFAVSNDSANLYVNNSTFTKNVGLHPSSSVGTVSCMNDGTREYDLVIKNSLFKENKGPVTGIGDHGTLAKIDIDNVVFDGNDGNITLLIYQGTGTLSNLTFKNEKNIVGQLDIRTAYNSTSKPKYQPNTITLKDITFENNDTPAEILIRKQSHNTSMNTVTVNLEGTIKGNIDILDGQKLNIKGTVIGNIYSEDTVAENIITESTEDKSTYNLYRYSNHYIATVNYPTSETSTSVEYLYLEKGKKYTEKEIFMMLKNNVEGVTTKYYTNNTYTTAWAYTGTSNINLYGKLEEHTHEFDGTLIVDNNIIYEQCTLGHFGKKISLDIPNNTIENGEEKTVTITNELNATNYVLKYYVKENDEWKETTSPIKAGTYKAILTHEGLTIEQEYTITKEIKNPNTSIRIYLIFLVSAICIIGIIIYVNLKRTKVKRYNN